MNRRGAYTQGRAWALILQRGHWWIDTLEPSGFAWAAHRRSVGGEQLAAEEGGEVWALFAGDALVAGRDLCASGRGLRRFGCKLVSERIDVSKPGRGRSTAASQEQVGLETRDPVGVDGAGVAFEQHKVLDGLTRLREGRRRGTRQQSDAAMRCGCRVGGKRAGSWCGRTYRLDVPGPVGDVGEHVAWAGTSRSEGTSFPSSDRARLGWRSGAHSSTVLSSESIII
jgi:hypothetical protein